MPPLFSGSLRRAIDRACDAEFSGFSPLSRPLIYRASQERCFCRRRVSSYAERAGVRHEMGGGHYADDAADIDDSQAAAISA